MVKQLKYIFFFIAQRFVKHFHTRTRYMYQLRKRKPNYLSFTLNALLIVSFSYYQKPSHSCKYKSFCPSYKLVKFWCPSIYKVILVSFLSNPFFVLCIIHSCMFSIQLDFILSSRAIHSFQPWPSPFSLPYLPYQYSLFSSRQHHTSIIKLLASIHSLFIINFIQSHRSTALPSPLSVCRHQSSTHLQLIPF